MTRKAALKSTKNLTEVYLYESIKAECYYKLVVDGDVIRVYSGNQILSRSVDLVAIWIKAQILLEVKENEF